MQCRVTPGLGAATPRAWTALMPLQLSSECQPCARRNVNPARVIRSDRRLVRPGHPAGHWDVTPRTQRISTQHTDLSAAAGRYRGDSWSAVPALHALFLDQRILSVGQFLGNDSRRPITSTLFTTVALRPIPIPAATRRRHGRAGGCLTRTSLTPLRRHWGFSLSSRGLLLGPRDVRPRARSHFLFLPLLPSGRRAGDVDP